MLKKVLAFADGENLVCRYQAMLDQGKVPKPEVVHERNSFVWHPEITRWSVLDLIRVSYYTSVVGDVDAVSKLETLIGSTAFLCEGVGGLVGTATLIPRVHKKSKSSNKTKVVDVDVTMDIVRAALTMPIDGIFLLSGDGDYLPLVRELTRSSKQVYLAAFSSGLAPCLRNSVDSFVDLDRICFVS